MKILCAYSGIEFNVEHFPGTFYSREAYHPIFNLPQKKLLGYLGKWAGQELTITDSYLLFLAILKSSDLVEFRVPVFRNEFTDSIVAQNMESLTKTVIKLNAVSSPAVVFPRYVISPETRFLSNITYWIKNWEDAYQDFANGVARDYDNRKLIHREAALERLIKNPHKNIAEYGKQVAEWAAIAGNFPVFTLTSPFTGLKTSLSDYWKVIITRCAKEELLYSIPREDLNELLLHCEEEIPIGSIYSNILFKVLRRGIEKQHNFLGLGDVDVTRSTYQILETSDTVEDANLKAMIDSAPQEIPEIGKYPSKLAYLRAKLRYDMAQKFKKEGQGQE